MKSPEERIRELINLTKALRAEGGCPWDRKQTLLSLRNYIIEEAYEVVDAISRNDIGNLKEEVGDLLLQVLFITNIAEEESMFTFEDVILELSDKLIRRHPHVFGDKSAKDENEALKIWDEQKALENNGENKDFPKTLPSLKRAIKISKFFSKDGLDFKSVKEVHRKLESEILEFDEAYKRNSKSNIEEELGDILFTVANLCRLNKIDPEIALNQSSDKFIERAKIFLAIKANYLNDEDAWEEAKLTLKERKK